MPFELSWILEGSVGFLINLFGFFELTMVVVRGREVCLFAPSTTASGGDEVVGAPIHPDWTQVV